MALEEGGLGITEQGAGAAQSREEHGLLATMAAKQLQEDKPLGGGTAAPDDGSPVEAAGGAFEAAVENHEPVAAATATFGVSIEGGILTAATKVGPVVADLAVSRVLSTDEDVGNASCAATAQGSPHGGIDFRIELSFSDPPPPPLLCTLG